MAEADKANFEVWKDALDKQQEYLRALETAKERGAHPNVLNRFRQKVAEMDAIMHDATDGPPETRDLLAHLEGQIAAMHSLIAMIEAGNYTTGDWENGRKDDTTQETLEVSKIMLADLEAAKETLLKG